MRDARARNRKTAIVLFSVVGGMVGLAYASVPLYQLFCQVTGYGGTTQVADKAPDGGNQKAATADQMITVRFDANVNGALPWKFRPAQREMKVRLGQEVLAFYTAKNLGETPLVGNATFNVTPYKAGPYFNKVDCFCFSEQKLAPGEEASLPVSFYVDPEIFAKANTQDVKTITLSYTFFLAPDDKQDGAARTARLGADDAAGG